MVYQELDYLRNELNLLLSVLSERVGKTTNTVLLVWGGALVILANTLNTIKPTMEIHLEHIPLYFVLTTVFFISNLILYITAQRFHSFVDGNCRLAAYIALFYEKRPKSTDQAGENLYWEWANFEIMANDNNAERKRKFFGKDCEYATLTLISIVLMAFFSLAIWVNILAWGNVTQVLVSIVLLLICIAYFVVSLCLLRKIPEFTSLRDEHKMKTEHLSTFIQYSLKTGHYTRADIEDRFGSTILNYIDDKSA